VKVGLKVWVENEGKAFGDGPWALLDAVRREGSLRRAANGLGMSYSKAWRLIRVLEQRLGHPLLVRQVGGTEGGGSLLTQEAEDLLERYSRFRAEVRELVESSFTRHFPLAPPPSGSEPDGGADSAAGKARPAPARALRGADPA
jgi:molybdate transport system regulatory protein